MNCCVHAYLIAVVHQDEEEVKSAHDGGCQVDVLLQTLAAVVAPTDWVGGSQDGGASIQGCLAGMEAKSSYSRVIIMILKNTTLTLECIILAFEAAYLDSRLGDADGLLLHGFVDGYLVLEVHLVKLVNAAHTLGRKTLPSVLPYTLYGLLQCPL